MAILCAEKLGKSYNGRQVVKNVSIEIQSGQIVGLLGPNGAGKTTCFDMIVGQVPLDKGRITLNDEDISLLPMHGRSKRGISYLPQQASVFRKLSVADNILAILETRADLTRTQRHDQLELLLEEFHIGHIRDTMGLSLSGGERRRVEIARSLAIEPSFILLDEPFAGVDPISVNDIKQIVKQLKARDIGVLITDHDVRETLDICERAYIVSNGQIIEAGNAETVLNNQQVKDVYLGQQFQL